MNLEEMTPAQLRELRAAIDQRLAMERNTARLAYEQALDAIIHTVVNYAAAGGYSGSGWRKNEEFVRMGVGEQELTVAVFHDEELHPRPIYGCVAIRDNATGTNVAWDEPPAPDVVLKLVKALRES